jgi:hypothetical protein
VKDWGTDGSSAAAALQALAGRGKSTRAGALARQLLDLRSAAGLSPSAALCLNRDALRMLDPA